MDSDISIDDLYKQFNSSPSGLTQAILKQHAAQYGENLLSTKNSYSWVKGLTKSFLNPLVLILTLAAIISYFLRETADTIIISIIILFSTLLDFFQEFHANNAARKLQETVTTHTTVIREGKEQEVVHNKLYPGDIILIRTGDIIPADARIISVNDFFVNESSLTGESFPIGKNESKPQNIIYAGSTVVSGSAKAIIIKTGKSTTFGKVSQLITNSSITSEFTNGVNAFSFFLTKIAIFMVIFILIVSIFFKHDNFLVSLTFAIAVAVGLIPELLPMIMSITMAKGSLRMAKKGAIVKKLTAIPDFGAMDVLCTDKTGTLTKDEISVIKYVDAQGQSSDLVLHNAYLNSYFQAGIKNPMDDAVLSFKKDDIASYTKIDEIPFDFTRRRLSTVVQTENHQILITKGSPEEVIAICTQYQIQKVQKSLDSKTKSTIIALYQSLSQEGFRVLAVATKTIKDTKQTYDIQIENDLTFLGFIAFLDPAKETVKAALIGLQAIGINIKIITGDNELVTKKVALDVGLPAEDIILGHMLDSLKDEQLPTVVEKTTIFARCSPEQKQRIITTLQKNNHIVGYLGDGINDAPSLITAHVGISVNNAVDVAKESADIILTHKNLHILKDGVIEGRKTFANTMKYVMMGVSSNFGNMFSYLGAILFLPFFPMLPIQILLNNLLYDISQITIPTDSVDSAYIQHPKRWNIESLTKFTYIFGSISSFFDFITFFILFAILKLNVPSFQTAWFLESLATQTLIIHVIRTRKIPFFKSIGSLYLIVSTLFIVICGWTLPYTALGHYFNFTPQNFITLVSIASIVGVYFFTVEVGKWFFFRHYTI